MNLYDMITKITKKLLKENHPDLYSIHYPVKAIVTKVYEESKYVDIRILDKYGNIDDEYPEIPKVKTNNTFKVNEAVIVNEADINVDTYHGTKLVNFPEYLEVDIKLKYEVGDVVRVGFYYNELSMPYIDGKVD